MSDEILRILNEQTQTLGELKEGMKHLIGNGQPGLVSKMRDDIDSLKESRTNAKGYVAGFSAALLVGETLYHYLVHKLSGN